MSTYKKVVSIAFSVIVLILGLLLMLTMGGVVSPSFGSNFVEFLAGGAVLSKIFFIIGLVVMFIALRELIFGERITSEGKEGLILENDSGKLIISKESLENLIAGVGKEVAGAESITSKTYIDVDKNVTVDVNIVIPRDVSIKEISAELQKKIKAALKQTVDLDVKYVNINIKNISNKKNKKNSQEEIIEAEDKVEEKTEKAEETEKAEKVASNNKKPNKENKKESK